MNGFLNHNKYLEENGGNLLFAQALLHNAMVTKRSRILEIGCGTGIFGEYFAAITQAKFIGLEQSLTMAQIARERIKCIYVPNGIIPHKIGLFDLIYCQAVLPLIDNKDHFYKMISHHLEGGGVFSSYLPSIEDIIAKPLHNFIPLVAESSISRYQSMGKNINLLYNAGFNKVKTLRISLGSVWLNEYYISKHRDGYFSNAKKISINERRAKSLMKMQTSLNTLSDYGITSHYEFERTMIIAQK